MATRVAAAGVPQAVPRPTDLGRTLFFVCVALGGVGFALLLGSVAGDRPLLAIAAAAAVLVAFAIAAQPDTATIVVIALIYSNAAVIAVNLHGLPFAISVIVPMLLIAPLGYRLLIRREPFVIAPALPWMLAYLFVHIVSTLFARDLDRAVSTFTVYLLEGLLLFFLITNVVRTPELLRRAIWCLLGVGAFLGLLSVYQQLTGSFGNDYFGFAQASQAVFTTGAGGEQPRLAGPLGDQNRYAQIMLVLVPLGLMRLYDEKRALLKLTAAGATIFIAFGAALTFSRGGAVGFLLMLVLMAFLRYIKLYQLALVVLGIVLLLVALPQYRDRLSTLGALPGVTESSAQEGAGPDSAVQSRATENLTGALIFADHPVVGVGPGNYPSYYTEYAHQVYDVGAAEGAVNVKSGPRQAHSLYLAVAAETGLLGMIAFGGVIVVTWRGLTRARKRWLSERPELANTATAFLLAMITYLTTAIFLHLSYARYFWILMALASAAIYVARKAEQEVVREPVPEPVSRGPAGAVLTNRR